MSTLLSQLEGKERRAECEKHEQRESAADRRRMKWVAAAIRARKDMGECDCETVMVLEMDGLHAGRME